MEGIVGRGTWLDSLSTRIIERERKLGRDGRKLRVESGLSASGVPHIGNLSDGIRTFSVKLALQDAGREAEYIAFADDMDGLRSVPSGFPEKLRDYLGMPVNRVPDLLGCHGKFSDHTTGLLKESLDKCDVQYTFMSATEAYGRGLFKSQIEKLLVSAEAIGRIIEEEVGQERYREVLPYFPVCGSCGRILSTAATEFLAGKGVVRYECSGRELKRGRIDGCGHKGEVRIGEADGKLSWKVEFAARWSALKINFEAYGKDIADSVRVNDRVMEEILGEPAPYHVRYELFLDKSGKKVAKSVGNIITAQQWFQYGSPESLILLMLKRIVGTRAVGLEDIVTYERELDQLEDIYFGLRKVSDRKELARLRGLFEYVWRLRPPEKAGAHVPHGLLVNLARVAPVEMRDAYVLKKLGEYGYGSIEDARLKERVERALHWARDFSQLRPERFKVGVREEKALRTLVERIRKPGDEDQMQNGIFEIAKEHGLEPGEFFALLYRILFGETRGPRLGPYIVDVGAENVARALSEFLAG